MTNIIDMINTPQLIHELRKRNPKITDLSFVTSYELKKELITRKSIRACLIISEEEDNNALYNNITHHGTIFHLRGLLEYADRYFEHILNTL